MVLKKESLVFARDDKGELLPIEAELEVNEEDEEQKPYKGETIFVTPLPRGKVRKMFSEVGLKKGNEKDRDLDKTLILEHCKDPSFTEEDVDAMKLAYTSMLVDTILRVSGLNTKKPKRESMEEKETEFSKNSNELSPQEKTAT